MSSPPHYTSEVPSAATTAILGGGSSRVASKQQRAGTTSSVGEFRIVNITGGARSGGGGYLPVEDEAMRYTYSEGGDSDAYENVDPVINGSSSTTTTTTPSIASNTNDRLQQLQADIAELQHQLQSRVASESETTEPRVTQETQIADMEKQVASLREQLANNNIEQADRITSDTTIPEQAAGGFKKWFGLGGDGENANKTAPNAPPLNATVSTAASPPADGSSDDESATDIEDGSAGDDAGVGADESIVVGDESESDDSSSVVSADPDEAASVVSSNSSAESSVSTTSLLASGNLYLTLSKMFITETPPHENKSVAEVLWTIGEQMGKLNDTLSGAIGKIETLHQRYIARGRSRSMSSHKKSARR